MPAGLLHVYRIEFHSRTVPQCYLKWRILDFTNTDRVIWVRTRKRRDELLSCDLSARYSAHSVVFSPASCCFSAAIICSSVCPFFGMSSLLVLATEDHAA